MTNISSRSFGVGVSAENRCGIFLLAGVSSRFNGLVEHKSLLKLGERSLLERLILGAASLGIDEYVFAVGASAELIQDEVIQVLKNNQVHFQKLEFVFNVHYATTNNIYSLWLCRQFLQGGVFVFEGDIWFDFGQLKIVLLDKSFWFGVAGYLGDGSFILPDGNGRIIDYTLARDGVVPASGYKSAGLFYFSRGTTERLSYWLDVYVNKSRRVDLYFDQVIADNLSEIPIYVHPVDEARWHEIDTPEDFEVAKQKFGNVYI